MGHGARLSLRSQITIPIVALTVLTLLAATLLNAIQARRQVRTEIQERLKRVVKTLETATFPLTGPVLAQMTGLSGAHFILVDASGAMLATSLAASEPVDLHELSTGPNSDTIFGERVMVGEKRYFGSTVKVHRSGQDLHILYPEARYRDAGRAAMVTPLLIGLVGSLLAAVLGTLIAARVARPVSQLQKQVDKIAGGKYDLVLPRTGANEFIELSDAVSSMADRLASYDRDVRRNERLRTLGQLGGGIAHQLRNAVTGSRLALDLHQRSCSTPDDEALEVASQQLTLMEEYVKRFLAVGISRSAERKLVDVGELFDSTFLLLMATAKHAKVDLQWEMPHAGVRISGDRAALQQLMIDLVINAIEAASISKGEPAREPRVNIAVHATDSCLAIDVSDNGPGPAPQIGSTMFEPLVSDKPDGVGMGLSVARDIVERHSGTLQWRRESDWTCFTVLLPLKYKDSTNAEADGS